MARNRTDNVWVSRKLIQSLAFRELDGKAAKVLLWFFTKRQFSPYKYAGNKNWIQTNNGEIIFTYDEAQVKYGLSRQVFSRLLDDLVEKGFIDIDTQGIGIAKAPTLYSMSNRWEYYGKPTFKQGKRKKRTSYRFPTGKDHPIHKRGESNG